MAAQGQIRDYVFGPGPLGLALQETGSGLVRISSVQPGSQASQNGVPVGAAIVTVAGQDVRNKGKAEVTKLLGGLPRPVKIGMEVSQPSPATASSTTPASSTTGQGRDYVFGPGPLGLALQETSSGLRILSVQPGSAANQKGVPVGAAVLTVGGQDVRNKTKAEVTKLLVELPRPITVRMEAMAPGPPSPPNRPPATPSSSSSSPNRGPPPGQSEEDAELAHKLGLFKQASNLSSTAATEANAAAQAAFGKTSPSKPPSPPKPPSAAPPPPPQKYTVGAKCLVARSNGEKTPCTVLAYDPKTKAYKVQVDGTDIKKMAKEDMLEPMKPPPATEAKSAAPAAASTTTTTAATAATAKASAQGQIRDYVFGPGPLGLALQETGSGLVRISSVQPGSQASQNGVPVGAAIVTVAGQDVRNKGKAEVTKLLGGLPRPVKIGMEVSQPSPATASSTTPASSTTGQGRDYVFGPGPLGLALQETSSGLRILSVQPGSAANQKGVPVGAAVLTVGGQDVRNKTKAEVTKLLVELPRPITVRMEAMAPGPPSPPNRPPATPSSSSSSPNRGPPPGQSEEDAELAHKLGLFKQASNLSSTAATEANAAAQAAFGKTSPSKPPSPPKPPSAAPPPPPQKYTVGAKCLVARSNGEKTPCTVLAYDPKTKAYKVQVDGTDIKKMAKEDMLEPMKPPPATEAKSAAPAAASTTTTTAATAATAKASAQGQIRDYVFGPGPLGLALQETGSGLVRISSVQPGSQASQNGVPVGAAIVTVAGQDVRNKGKAEVTKLLGGLPRPVKIGMEVSQPSPATASSTTPASSTTGQGRDYVFGPGPLGLALQETSSGLRILSVQPGSAAFQKSVQIGAAVLTVGGHDVRNKTKAEVTKLLVELPRPITVRMEATVQVEPPATEAKSAAPAASSTTTTTTASKESASPQPPPGMKPSGSDDDLRKSIEGLPPAQQVAFIKDNGFGDWASFNKWLSNKYEPDELLEFEFDEDALDVYHDFRNEQRESFKKKKAAAMAPAPAPATPTGGLSSSGSFREKSKSTPMPPPTPTAPPLAAPAVEKPAVVEDKDAHLQPGYTGRAKAASPPPAVEKPTPTPVKPSESVMARTGSRLNAPPVSRPPPAKAPAPTPAKAPAPSPAADWLSGVFGSSVNAIESVTGLDLDGDGKVGGVPAKAPAPTQAPRATSKPPPLAKAASSLSPLMQRPRVRRSWRLARCGSGAHSSSKRLQQRRQLSVHRRHRRRQRGRHLRLSRH